MHNVRDQITLPLVLPNVELVPSASNRTLQSVIKDGRHSLRISLANIRQAGGSVTNDEYRLETPYLCFECI